MTSDVESETSEALLSNRLLFRITLVIGLLAALAAGLSVAGRWIGEELSLGGNTDSREILHIMVGQDLLALPANVIRFESQRRNGRAESVSIFLSWPALEGFTRQHEATFSDPRRSHQLIFAEFSQSVMSRDMSGRVDPIYRKLFEGEATRGPAGLEVRALSRKSGFGEEKLLIARLPGGGLYAVRCLLPLDAASSTSADCLRDVKVGRDLTMLYRFSAALLPQWRQIDDAMRVYAEKHLTPPQPEGT